MTGETHNIESVEHLGRLAGEFSQKLRVGDVVLLKGELGAGKTAFTQAVGKYLHVSDAISSPTFTVEARYPIQGNHIAELVHIDLYRIGDLSNTSEHGLHMRELFEHAADNGQVVFVEWAERLGDIVPDQYWELVFEHGESIDKRIVTMTYYD